ncbi:carbohydrate ABC transporter permease [Marinactinospora thermotolerans]|uniref:Carbohydrate ABC transporter membrane protein 1, CUT1 family (TC 3.A.1.1.-) n=1 Tax=Marinactinospora thermotolerans DSM 45154 TaxID=1122192 RepID=A0A1T4LJT8_9ACTN|nr:sugar ABC transporter permease [Marinactinospora thermotolerans]SJZ54817.1 carbohydrate ABC transporter membrane protein 1, CUT1 family (TC 3.A.1.1.-) [Marinactinospora thermotolerans DSM 45154]
MAQTAEVTTPADPAPGPGRDPKAGRADHSLLRTILKKTPPYALIAPALIFLAVILLWPIAQMVWNSLHGYTIRHLSPAGPDPEWNDFEHYIRLLSDPGFWSILRNTVLVCVLMVGITMVLGTLVGILLHKLPQWFSTVVAVGMMLAWATPAMSASLVFRWLFLPGRGLVNHVLESLPDWLVGSGWTDYNWFLEPLSLFSVLITVIVWQSFPFVAVSVLAGLKSIPNELYEAARMDGAGGWRSFWNITLPMLRPLFSLILVLQIIWDLRVFTQLYVLANSFQNKDVYLLSYYIYQQGFNASPPNYGMGSAIAVVMTVMILIVTAYYLRIMIRQGETR